MINIPVSRLVSEGHRELHRSLPEGYYLYTEQLPEGGMVTALKRVEDSQEDKYMITVSSKPLFSCTCEPVAFSYNLETRHLTVKTVFKEPENLPENL